MNDDEMDLVWSVAFICLSVLALLQASLEGEFNAWVVGYCISAVTCAGIGAYLWDRAWNPDPPEEQHGEEDDPAA
jgi:hypothetical protein